MEMDLSKSIVLNKFSVETVSNLIRVVNIFSSKTLSYFNSFQQSLQNTTI